MNPHLCLSHILSAAAVLAFAPVYFQDARADERSEAFDQRMLMDTCVKRGSAEPKQRIVACSTIIGGGNLAAAETALAYLNRATAYKATGEPTKAAADYAESLRRYDNLADPQQPAAQIVYQRAVALQALGQIDRAMSAYDDAIRLDPENAIPLIKRGSALVLHKGELPRALADFSRALVLSPDNVEALLGRGDTYGRLGDFDRSFADIDRAIRLDPNNAEAHVMRGLANARRGNSQSAATDYDGALAIDPRNMDALINRAALYSIVGQMDKALADLDAAIAIRDNDSLAYFNRGYVQFSRKKYDEAIADYGRSIELDPRMAMAYNNRCMTLILAGRNADAALADCNKAGELAPDDIDVRDTRGFVYLKTGKPELAVAEYDRALAIDPKRALALYGRGLGRIRSGDIAAGNADRAAASALVPDIGTQFSTYGLE
jgi:tetratricopeptide (TPR) repeat protein